MEVPAAGMGASAPDRAVGNPPVPAANVPAARPATAAGDSVAALLSELSHSDLTSLLQIVDRPLPALDEASAGELLRSAAGAVAGNHPSRALDLVRQFAALDPVRAEGLASAPSFTPIRADVEQLFAQLSSTARLHAEGRLSDASRTLESGILKNLSADLKPEVLIQVASSLMAIGGLSNYMRSAAVSTAILDQARWLPSADTGPAALPQTDDSGRQGHLPLVVWLAAGLVGIALCWWLKEDDLTLVCGVWAGLGILFMFRRGRRR
ncbi:MAG TPA: hypothetical protein VHW09_23085 [Bryobacteraceae bacterium]|jgi:hypothetical protein|nr:hypothetical protein [Bryobacteraceae bacterium]